MDEAQTLGWLDDVDDYTTLLVETWTELNVGNILNSCRDDMYDVIYSALFGDEVFHTSLTHVEMSSNTKATSTWNMTYKEVPNFISPGMNHPPRLLPKELFTKGSWQRKDDDVYMLHEDGNPAYIASYGTIKDYKKKNDMFRNHVMKNLKFKHPPLPIPEYRYKINKIAYIRNPNKKLGGYYHFQNNLIAPSVHICINSSLVNTN